MLISTTVCHPGLVREHNEDSCISNVQDQLWLVADGVGGNAGGQIASQLAAQTVERKYRQGCDLRTAILEANDAIRLAVSRQSELKGMATTIVAAGFSGSDFQLAWLGDSRAYLISNAGMRLLSSDHNVANELLLKGKIKADEAVSHPGQHELTQALGQYSLAEIPIISGTLNEHDVLLLCSDGLSGVLSETAIMETIQRTSGLKAMADDLLQQVLGAGAPDNIGFILIKKSANAELSKTNSGPSERRIQSGKNYAPLTGVILIVVILVVVSLFF